MDNHTVTWQQVPTFLVTHGLWSDRFMSHKSAQAGHCRISSLWIPKTADESYSADMCPLTEVEGELQLLHDVNNHTFNWLETTATTALVKWNEKYKTHISPLADNIIYIAETRWQTDNTLVDCTAAVLLCQLFLSYRNPAKWPHCKPDWITTGYVWRQDFILLASTITRSLFTVQQHQTSIRSYHNVQ